MKEIPLTQGKVALVDDEDFDFLNQWKWHAVKWKNGFYARRNLKIDGVMKNIMMHRVIMEMEKYPDLLIDHENGDTLDNQRKNLRKTDYKGNSANRFVAKNASSKYL